MPDLPAIKTYPPLKVKQVEGKPVEIKVDKPGVQGKQVQQKGVRFRPLKITKKIRVRKNRDPRNREYF